MKRNFFSIRAAVTAIGAMCGAIMIPTISHANAVLVNNTTVCPSSASAASMSLTPSGDLNITCAAASGPPSCTVGPASSTIGTGQTVTLTANCSPAATSYTWTGGPPTMGGASASLTFPTAGTFSYTVQGSNASGAGAVSAAATVTVQAASVAPVCSVSASPTNITAGGTSTLTAVCNPAATTYAWNGTGPAVSGAGGTVTFPTAGTFSYTVQGSNTVGPGAVSPSTSVVVTAAGSCVPKAVAGAYTGNSTKFVAIDRGGSVTYSLPVYSTPGRIIEMLSIQSTASQSDLTSEFSISSCPGDFDNMQAECKTWGSVNTSGTQLDAIVWGTPYPGTCTMISGQQYYINVRNTKYDKVTPACNVQTCYMNVQLNSY